MQIEQAKSIRLRHLWSALVLAMPLLGGVFISTPTNANTDRPPVAKGMPMPPPLTLSEKISASAYIVVGQIERVDYMYQSGRPSEYWILDHVSTDFSTGGEEVRSIRVSEILKWPREELAANHIKLIHTEGSWADFPQRRYSPGSQWVFFLRSSEGNLKSAPPEFFGAHPVLRIPFSGHSVLPEPLNLLPEVRQAIDKLQK